MRKEENVFNTVKDKIADLIEKSNVLAGKKEKSNFIENLSILNNVNEEIAKLYENGVCQFSKHVSIIIHMLLTNQKLLDKIVGATFEVIRDSGDYRVVNKNNMSDTPPNATKR